MGADLSLTERLELHRWLIGRSHLAAMEYVAEALEGTPLIDGPHLGPIAAAIDRVICPTDEAERITRLLINISPGYSKTFSAVWTLIARGLAVNPGSRFIHTSYSADLALDNSTKVRDILQSEAWQTLCPVTLRADVGAKGLWRTDEEGGIRATQAGGAITGFRAGRMGEGFTGAMVIDDPLKPDDARSRKKVADQNRRYNTTIANRLAHEDVPIIVIMQRLAAFPSKPGDDPAESGDMSEFLLRGGSGEEWDHLELPAMIDNSREYPSEWTHGRPIAHDLPDGPLWPEKLSAVHCARLKRASPYVYAAQQDQRPKQRTGDPLVEGAWFPRYRNLPSIRRIELFGDTASKTAERNDYTALLAAGLGDDGDLYVLDLLRGKWKTPQLLPVATDFWEKWRSQGAAALHVEDAASGTYLIQAMQESMGSTIRPIRRTKDKFTRVSGVTERMSSGRVHLPASAPWVADLIDELESFTDDDSHAHDDMVDVLTDAIEVLLPVATYDLAALA